MNLAIGVDIGGTKIDFVLVNEQGEILFEHRLPTRPEEGSSAIHGRLREGIQTVLAQAPDQVRGIGIGCPGHVDPVSGIVRTAVNLGWSAVPLKDMLQADLKLPIYLQNDVNAAALGEQVFGAAQGCADFVYLAVGTGLGGAAVVHGQIVNGTNAFAMEIGHLSLDLNGRLCKCGQRGCIEQYVSGVGLLAAVQEHGANYPDSVLRQHSDLATSAILDAARTGDPLALYVLEEAGQWLGRAFACCATFLNPPLMILGGGMGLAAAEWLLPPALADFRQRVLSHISAPMRVELSRVPRIAIGAAAQVFID